MVDMDTLITEQARLIILRALAGQTGETLNSDLILPQLQAFAIRKDRAWLHDEMRWLGERGAVKLTEVGSVLVATLTEKGARHLSRELAIEGVQRPSRLGD